MTPAESQVETRVTTISQTRVAEPRFQHVPCPLCGSTTFTVVRPGRFPTEFSEQFLREVYRSSSDHALFEQVVRCTTCELVYLNPRLESELIIGSYAQGEDAAHVAQDAMRIRTFTKALHGLARRYDIPLSRATTLLDIGCASGAFLKAAHELGLTTVGIEPNRWMAAYGRTMYGLDVRAGTLADHHFADGQFDLVTLWDVIEHVPNPSAELDEIHRILKPGGLLLVNYPDYTSLPARVLGWKWPFWLSVHLTYYSPETIRAQLDKARFKVLELGPHWQTLELDYVLKRMTPYVPLAKLPRWLVGKLGLGHLPLTYWVGQTRVVAQKCDS